MRGIFCREYSKIEFKLPASGALTKKRSTLLLVRPSNNPHLKGIPNIRFSDSTLERRSLLPSLHLSYSAVVIKLIVEMTVIWLKYDDGELTKVDIEIRTDTDFYDVKKALKLEAPNRFGGLDAAAITVKNPRTQLPINSDELLVD